ncbi:MAG: hypothetical protein JRJ86_14635 [Deltaproteobacteria bacterium]|nr:hypothetical protein [Deltaproteobacteria bacterium]MBW1795503.1 hypothetical protein [Deltaproteobacteria bacterium]
MGNQQNIESLSSDKLLWLVNQIFTAFPEDCTGPMRHRKRIGTFMPRKHFTTSLDEVLLKAIKKLAIDLDRSVNDLL